MTIGVENKSQPVIVLGLSPTGLHVVRELSNETNVIYGVANGLQPGCWSRFLKQCYYLSSTDEKGLFELIRTIFKGSSKRPLLIPTSDDYITFIENHAKKLQEFSDFSHCYSDGMSRVLTDKVSFAQWCDEMSFKIPRTWSCQARELETLRKSLILPMLIKPARSMDMLSEFHFRKVMVVETEIDFKKALDVVRLSESPIVVQEIIPGGDDSIWIYGCYRNSIGNYVAEFTGRKLRQFPPDFGSASAAVSEKNEAVERISKQILDALGYVGIASVEFKQHCETGELFLIEINARPGLWYGLSSASNVHIVKAWLHSMLGEEPSYEERLEQKSGITWRYVPKDILALTIGIKKIVLNPKKNTKAYGLFNCVFLSNSYPVFYLYDIKPVFLDFFLLFYKFLSRKLKREKVRN